MVQKKRLVNYQYSRLLNRYGNVFPTIFSGSTSAFTEHQQMVLGNWAVSDIGDHELYFKDDEQRAFVRIGDTIKEFNLTTGTTPTGDYVNKSGDTMSGQLITPSVSATTILTDKINFNTNINPSAFTHVEGSLHWNNDDKTLELMSDVSDFNLQIGQENVIRVVNKTGGDILNGTVVYISGAQGNRPTIDIACITGTTCYNKVIGVTTHDIINNRNGYVTTFGLVRDLNTNTFNEGDELYVSSGGTITNIKPLQPLHAIKIGYCVTSSSTSGIILVRVEDNKKLSDLIDVTNNVTGATNNQILTFNSTLNLWENSSDIIVNNISATTAYFGCATGYTSFDSNGNLEMVGSATVFRDEMNELIKASANNPSSHLVQNFVEGTLDFKDNCDLNDYAVMNIQLNHDRKLASKVFPHVHWYQNQNATPNFLVQYRWQRNGHLKTTAWTNYVMTGNAYTYSATTTNQITYNGGITPPANDGLSDIIQIRLIRDMDNDSSAFTSNDLYVGTVQTVNFDVHIELDDLGSDEEYVK